MIKKNFIDTLCIVLFIAIGILAVERPVIDQNVRSSVATKRQPSDVKKEETKEAERGIIRDVVTYDALKDRNIFAADGKYAIVAMSGPGMKGPLPENPYTLIGILQGEEKKAVFREHTGSIITLTVGKELIDGSVITRIDNLSVEVKRGKEKRELRIFSVKKPKPVTRQNP